MSTDDKIKVIDSICTRHPAYGVDKGWSEYVGGMRDTGRWFFRKMLDVPEEDLQLFLDEIIAEENEPKAPLTEQQKADQKIIHYSSNGYWMNEHDRKNMESFNNEITKKLLYP